MERSDFDSDEAYLKALKAEQMKLVEKLAPQFLEIGLHEVRSYMHMLSFLKQIESIALTHPSEGQRVIHKLASEKLRENLSLTPEEAIP